jgi:recombination protein RecR
MKRLPPTLLALIEALCCLPGVGPKTATRMALQLIDRKRAQAERLVEHLTSALHALQKCAKCRFLTESTLCDVCRDDTRDRTQLCIVESPIDLLAIEEVQVYRGVYFVLMGRLSPLSGIGPDHLGIASLVARLKEEPFQEIILATSLTVEGETTAHYLLTLCEQLKAKTGLSFHVSRIAQGVPMGGELDHIDARTLFNALNKREKWFDTTKTDE